MFEEEVGDKYAERIQAQSDKDSDNSAYTASGDPNEDSAGSSDEVACCCWLRLHT